MVIISYPEIRKILRVNPKSRRETLRSGSVWVVGGLRRRRVQAPVIISAETQS